MGIRIIHAVAFGTAAFLAAAVGLIFAAFGDAGFSLSILAAASGTAAAMGYFFPVQIRADTRRPRLAAAGKGLLYALVAMVVCATATAMILTFSGNDPAQIIRIILFGNILTQVYCGPVAYPLAALASLAACRFSKGVGEDVESTIEGVF
jgi:hypothetical protein